MTAAKKEQLAIGAGIHTLGIMSISEIKKNVYQRTTYDNGADLGHALPRRLRTGIAFLARDGLERTKENDGIS